MYNTNKYIYHDLKPKFQFQNDVIAKHWTLQNIGRKWKDFKSRLCIEFYDPSLNRDELISKCPIGIHRDQWSSFVNYRLSEKSKHVGDVGVTHEIQLCNRLLVFTMYRDFCATLIVHTF
nr:uncharacterized LOC107815048 [Ipomoea batatas]